MPTDPIDQYYEDAKGTVNHLMRFIAKNRAAFPRKSWPENTHFYDKKMDDKNPDSKFERTVESRNKIEESVKELKKLPETKETKQVEVELKKLNEQLKTLYNSLLEGKSVLEDKEGKPLNPEVKLTKEGANQAIESKILEMNAALDALAAQAGAPANPAITTFIKDQKAMLGKLAETFHKDINQLNTDLLKQKARYQQNLYVKYFMKGQLKREDYLWCPHYASTQTDKELFMKELKHEMHEDINSAYVGMDYAEAMDKVMKKYLDQESCYFRIFGEAGNDYMIHRQRDSKTGNYSISVQMSPPGKPFPTDPTELFKLFRQVLEFQKQTGTTKETIKVIYPSSALTTPTDINAIIMQVRALVKAAKLGVPPRMVELEPQVMAAIFAGPEKGRFQTNIPIIGGIVFATEGQKLRQEFDELQTMVAEYRKAATRDLATAKTAADAKAKAVTPAEIKAAEQLEKEAKELEARRTFERPQQQRP
jgi:hypothetical protein